LRLQEVEDDRSLRLVVVSVSKGNYMTHTSIHLTTSSASIIFAALVLLSGCTSDNVRATSSGCRAVIYEDAGYRGMFSRDIDRNESNLDETDNAFIPIKPGEDMNDKTSSARIYGGAWTFYVDANYQGQSYGPTTESIENFANIPGMNDKVSSLKCN
jgi:hypothetical protein